MCTNDAEEDRRNATFRVWVNGDLVPATRRASRLRQRLHAGRRRVGGAEAALRPLGVSRRSPRPAVRGGAGDRPRRRPRPRRCRGRAGGRGQLTAWKRCPRPADGDPRPEGAAVPASAAVPVRADGGDHHGAFAEGGRAVEPGMAVELRVLAHRQAADLRHRREPHPAGLRARLHPGREGRGRRGADARPTASSTRRTLARGSLGKPTSAQTRSRVATTSSPR